MIIDSMPPPPRDQMNTNNSAKEEFITEGIIDNNRFEIIRILSIPKQIQNLIIRVNLYENKYYEYSF